MEQTIERPVGFWRRLAASVLDGVILYIPFAVLDFFFANNQELPGQDPITSQGAWTGDLVASLVQLLYYLIVPVLWSGYTIGKRIAGIRIVKVNGENIGIGTTLLRYLVGSLVYIVTLGIGAIVSAFMVGLRQDKRAIHDFIAGTYVTSQKP